MQVQTSLVAAAVLMLFASSGLAQSAQGTVGTTGELWLSNDTVQLRYLTSGERFGARGSRAFADFFLSEDRDIVMTGGLLFPLDVDLGPLSFEVGPRAYAALLDEENDDVLGLSVGTEIRFDINRKSGLAIVGQAYYSPDILTFGSADNILDLSARAQIRVAERMIAFAGMRWFEFDLTEGGDERTLQEEIFIGVGYRL